MTFNATKSKVMHVTRKRNLQLPIYMLDHSQLSITNSFKYLGVTLNSQLTWNDHVKDVVLRANRMLGLERTVAFNSSVSDKICLYKSLVLPILEYGIPAWLPQTQIQERIQRRATRFILGQRFGEMSYTNRLCALKWTSLSSRRNCLMTSFVVKCLFYTIKCESVNKNIVVNHRYDSALTFKHLFARTQSLPLSAI